jgi:hypothetical protein
MSNVATRRRAGQPIWVSLHRGSGVRELDGCARILKTSGLHT